MYDETLAYLEQKRKAIVPLMIGDIILFVVGFFMIVLHPAALILGLLTAIILYAVMISPKLKAYKKEYKELVVRKPFAETFDRLIYQPTAGFQEQAIKQTGIVMMGNRFHSEDYISGCYKGVPFERADVNIEQHTTDSKGNSHTTTYFEGRWIIFQFNKNFHSDLQLVDRHFSYANEKTGIFTKKADRRHKIEFEDMNFNQVFHSYCQNDQEAYYLMTPHLMQSILQLKELIKGDFLLGFVDNRLHVAINTHVNLLEPSVFKALTYQNDILPVKEEIQAITSFVDHLKLDNTLFKQNTI